MELKNYLQTRRGAAKSLAAALKLNGTPVSIYQWSTKARLCPVDRCIEIELATAGEVRVEELRPDFPWEAFFKGRSGAGVSHV